MIKRLDPPTASSFLPLMTIYVLLTIKALAVTAPPVRSPNEYYQVIFIGSYTDILEGMILT
jgi:hypothetical protein